MRKDVKSTVLRLFWFEKQGKGPDDERGGKDQDGEEGGRLDRVRPPTASMLDGQGFRRRQNQLTKKEKGRGLRGETVYLGKEPRLPTEAMERGSEGKDYAR